MGNNFNKIESKIDTDINSVESLGWKDTVNTVESLGWKDTQVPLETVDSLGFNDTVQSLGWKNTENGVDSATSSPFVSTELFNKIMEGGNKSDSTSSLADSKDFDSSSSSDNSTSTSELSKMLSLSDYSKQSKKQHSQTGSSIEAYGFSNTSSEISQKFVINSDTSVSKSPFVAQSSSINTSDINLVSVDKSDINHVSANSVNGKRYLS